MTFPKIVYPYQYINDWKNFIETLLPKREHFSSNLQMKDITDVDYKHTKIAEIKRLVNITIFVFEAIHFS